MQQTSVSADCGSGVMHNNSCYYLVEDFKDWDAAHADCGNHGAHLVTITSEEENLFVNNYVIDTNPSGMFRCFVIKAVASIHMS